MKHFQTTLVIAGVVLLCFVATVAAQSSAPAVIWEKTFDGISNDTVVDIAQAANGDYILIGETNVSEPVSGAKLIMDTRGRISTPLLVRIDPAGNLVWEKTFGNGAGGIGREVQVLPDGSLIATGSTGTAGTGQHDIYLFRIAADGTVIWEKNYGEAGNDRGLAVDVSPDGSGYLVTGLTTFPDGNQDMILIRTDPSGNRIWEKTFGLGGLDIGLDVVAAPDGGWVVAGARGVTGPSNAVSSDSYILKVDKDGNKVWETTLGGAGRDRANYIARTSTGYAVAGDEQNVTTGRSSMFLALLDESGNLKWEKTYSGLGNAQGFSVVPETDGGFALSGVTYATGETTEAYLVRTDSSGTIVWEKRFGDGWTRTAREIEKTPDGGYIVAGGITSTASHMQDIWVAKLGPETVAPAATMTTAKSPVPAGLAVTAVALGLLAAGMKKKRS